MNPDHQTNSISLEKNHFPVLAQLGLLGFILLLLFSAFLLPENHAAENPKQVTKTPVAALSMTEMIDPAPPMVLEEVNVRAQAAYVWDVKAQRALYAKNEADLLPLASIAKLMTTLLSYELVDDQTQVTVPAAAIMQEGMSGLMVGEKLSMSSLRDLALVSSSNDAAYALAVNTGELLGAADPEKQFVAGMNVRADELGLGTVDFWNTTGLDESAVQSGAIGSARDVSFLLEYIITNYPEIISATQLGSTRVYNTAGAYHEVSNTNEIASKIPNMIGSKTGYTDLAGGNLTIAFDIGNNRPIIVTVLGSTRDQRFSDVLVLVQAVQNTAGKQ